MGTTNIFLIILCSLTNSEWIDITGIIINAFLAVWIVVTIQNKITNKRVLKDHFIEELKDIKLEYQNLFSEINSDEIHPKTILPWFKLMNIRVNNLMISLNAKYKLDIGTLLPFQTDLSDLLTNNQDFTSQFRSNQNIVFTETSKGVFIKFQQDHMALFNDLIIKINDAK